jgi:hypothetical protein
MAVMAVRGSSISVNPDIDDTWISFLLKVGNGHLRTFLFLGALQFIWRLSSSK